jgi:hypothetical protein
MPPVRCDRDCIDIAGFGSAAAAGGTIIPVCGIRRLL